MNSIFTRLSTNTNGARDAIEEMGISFYTSTGDAREFGDVLGDLRAATQGMTREQKMNFANTVAGQRAQAGFFDFPLGKPGRFHKGLRPVADIVQVDAVPVRRGLNSSVLIYGGSSELVRCLEGFALHDPALFGLPAAPLVDGGQTLRPFLVEVAPHGLDLILRQTAAARGAVLLPGVKLHVRGLPVLRQAASLNSWPSRSLASCRTASSRLSTAPAPSFPGPCVDRRLPAF